MIVIGISIGKMPFRKILSSARMYFFCVVKLLVAPLAAAFLFRGLFSSEMLFGIFVLMFSMPVGSIVTMILNEYGRGGDHLQSGNCALHIALTDYDPGGGSPGTLRKKDKVKRPGKRPF